MLPSYFHYIFVHLRQKARLRPELSPKFLSTFGPNPTRKARPDLQLCAKQELYLSFEYFFATRGFNSQYWVASMASPAFFDQHSALEHKE